MAGCAPARARSSLPSRRHRAASPTSSSASRSPACSARRRRWRARPPIDAIVIGDGLRTDILAANRVGAESVLMLTGVTTRDDLDTAAPDERPTAVAADAAELERILEAFALDDRGVAA